MILWLSLSNTYLICALVFQFGSYFIHLTDEERNLRQQVQDLKLEQSSVSMSDEFAKYMKLQRKIDRLVDQVKKMGKNWIRSFGRYSNF